MIKVLLSGVSFLIALAFGGAAFHVLVNCFLPWRKAPATTHVTLLFGGIPFTGWQLLLPCAVFTVFAILSVLAGLWILRSRH